MEERAKGLQAEKETRRQQQLEYMKSLTLSAHGFRFREAEHLPPSLGNRFTTRAVRACRASDCTPEGKASALSGHPCHLVHDLSILFKNPMNQ